MSGVRGRSRNSAPDFGTERVRADLSREPEIAGVPLGLGSMARQSVADDGSFHRPSSSKVHIIAGDVMHLEQRCEFLEQKNAWLTARLLGSQRKFIENTLVNSAKGCAKRCFEAWRDVMGVYALEKQLEAQTESLDKCQAVARELGTALVTEQQARKEAEAMRQQAEDELKRALQEERELKADYEDKERHLEHIERKVFEVENALGKTRVSGQEVVNHTNNYERVCKEIEEGRRAKVFVDPVAHGLKLREEAHGVMQRATTLLRPQNGERAPRAVSPEREP